MLEAYKLILKQLGNFSMSDSNLHAHRKLCLVV